MRNSLLGPTFLGVVWAGAALCVSAVRRALSPAPRPRPGRVSLYSAHGLVVVHSLGKGSLTVKGGTTVGDVFITPMSPQDFAQAGGRTWDDLLGHEAVHARQWAALGLEMAIAYALAYLLQGERNVFERQAGLAQGGYRA